VNALGDDLTDIAFASPSPLSLCNDANVPNLPVLVKWLVGLDSHAEVQPPQLLAIIRNVLAAAALALTVMCFGYCVGSKRTRTPLDLPLTYARAPPSVFSLGDHQNRVRLQVNGTTHVTQKLNFSIIPIRCPYSNRPFKP
jgi:hypothetical protein